MLCTLTLVAIGYIWMGDDAFAYKACYYSCEQRTIIPANETCVKAYGEA